MNTKIIDLLEEEAHKNFYKSIGYTDGDRLKYNSFDDFISSIKSELPSTKK